MSATGRLIVIHPNGATSTEYIDSADGADLAFVDRLGKAVGGYIEIVPGFTRFDGGPCVAFCNEDGKLLKLDVNEYATLAWQAALGFDPRERGDWLVGSVVIICGPDELLKEL